MSSFSYYSHYERPRPLPAQGGIQARSRRGPIGETWWSQRFIELLESFGVGSRLTRGRTYARAGQVVELEVEPGLVLAKVQGSRYSPYRVRIRGKVLSEQQWRRVEKAMAAQALPLAKLLAGEMPHDIEELFAACKLTLFPRSKRELTASCSCPDWANPCKHIAAAYYILAERFDEDPFLIFAWRGREQDELLERLRARREAGSRGGGTGAGSGHAPRRPEAGAPLHALLDSFWSSGPALDGLHVSPLAGEAPEALLRRLGPAPVEAGGRNLAELLASAYPTLAQAAERRALAE
ncbi:MAG: SWIM zinc finger family protein [Actinobacteria bacterium]|nr:SWIM zinc finger family protein [Actinomycetota bacterium]